MRVLVITGSRADEGLLQGVIDALRADPYFTEATLGLHGSQFGDAYDATAMILAEDRPDMALVLGDRFEILAASTACHLARVPLAHIGGGDVTEGSYDDAMRDCISRMASLHFVTSEDSYERLREVGDDNITLIGNLALDFIMAGDWKKERPIQGPYVVVNYQPETIDGALEWDKVVEAVGGRTVVAFRPNPDRGSDEISERINAAGWTALTSLPRPDYLNVLYHCAEFIGNSSSMLYEAPALGIKTRMIGKRQRGRVAPLWGDGKASERIVKTLKAWKS